MTHAQEPWSFFIADGNDTAMITGNPLSHGIATTSKANARRIVACVNACASMSIEDVERWASHGGFISLQGMVFTCNQAAALIHANRQLADLTETVKDLIEIGNKLCTANADNADLMLEYHETHERAATSIALIQ